MCGFAGEMVLSASPSHGRRADVDLARRMAQAVAHRGPDDEGAFTSADGRCAIGFHRLAVIDPPGSPQPMTSDDGRLTVAFNGEIYNYLHLRRCLAGDGAVFRSAGDTEVLLHLYRRKGARMLEDLDGMFALALYDGAAGTLLLARDRLGQKPLWYAFLPDRIVFASQPQAILRHPAVPVQCDRESVCYYLELGYIPGPRSIWTQVRKLSPGSRLLVENCPTAPQRYWSPQPVAVPRDRRECVEAVRAAVTASVEQRMQADVPLGALLSGGLDSAIVVALMSRAAGRAGGVRTFTAGFDDASYDERVDATRLAQHCGTEHTELLIQPAPAAELDRLVEMFGEPFADSSALPTSLICQAARHQVTVALAGDGGDEAFGGYDRYRALRLAEMASPGRYLLVRLAGALARPFAPVEERSRLRRLVRFAEAMPYPPAVQYFMYRRLFAPDDLPRLLTDQFLAGLDPAGPAEWFCDLYEGAEFPNEPSFQSELPFAQRHDLLTYLPDDLLVKADIASMAWGLELRAPMLDHRVVTLGLSLPVELKIRGRRGKVVLREAFGDLLPGETLRAPKRGFGVPLGKWLREDLFEVLRDSLMDPWLHETGIFRREALAGLLNDHFSGRGDHSHRLWALLVFAKWLKGRGGLELG